MKRRRHGPCGLYCGACGATDCDGCRSERIDDTIRQCKFRQCSKEMNIEFCCFCDDYPCRELDRFLHDQWPHHGTVEPNLEYIRKHGKAEWLQAQEEEWSCRGCGAQTFWYQKSCRCGRQLDAWDLPT